MQRSKSNIVTLTHEPLDYKAANIISHEDNIIIESISDYLLRVKSGIRSPGAIITILENPNNLETVTVSRASLDVTLRDYENKYYAFTGGIRDEDFLEIVFGGGGNTNYGLIQFISGNEPSTPVPLSQYVYMRSYGQSPNKVTILAVKNELGQEIIITSLIT